MAIKNGILAFAGNELPVSFYNPNVPGSAVIIQDQDGNNYIPESINVKCTVIQNTDPDNPDSGGFPSNMFGIYIDVSELANELYEKTGMDIAVNIYQSYGNVLICLGEGGD